MSTLTQKHKETLASIHSLFEGDKEAAHIWMMTANKALSGEKPINLLWTCEGCDMLMVLVGKLEKGVVL